jgi:TrmH family RNA methyltransferase
VREALAADAVVELFATAEAIERDPRLAAGASEISPKDAGALSQTVTPQGLVAVCALRQPSLADVLAAAPQLVVVLFEPNDPGNLGTIIRTADAAGADAVVVEGGVDPYNGKAVRASAGSVFHLPIVSAAAAEVFAGAPSMTKLATAGGGDVDLDSLDRSGMLAAPTVWLFGTEAHGLPRALIVAADHAVNIPIYGRAESLNLASAAAVCLYASARAQRRREP